MYLALADFEHFGTTNWANTLRGRLTIFHGDSPRIAYLSFSAALHTVGLHLYTPFFI
jgi:hypothetical protein